MFIGRDRGNMVKQMTNKEVTHFKKEVLTALDKYLTSLISKGESSKATKIITWIRDWTNFLKFENKFQSKRLPALQRGALSAPISVSTLVKSTVVLTMELF